MKRKSLKKTIGTAAAALASSWYGWSYEEE